MSEPFDMEQIGMQIDPEGPSGFSTNNLINNIEPFAKEAAKTLDKVIGKYLEAYGITQENMWEYQNRIEVLLYSDDLGETRRRYYLDGEYLFTVRSLVNSDFENLRIVYKVEMIFEE